MGPSSLSFYCLNRNVIGMGTTSLLSDWGHEMAAAFGYAAAAMGVGAVVIARVR